MAAGNLVNPATLVDAHLSRGDTIRIEIKDGPTAKVPVQLTLARGGTVLEPEEADYTPAAGQNPGVLTAKVNDDAPYGTYAVGAVVNQRAFPITAKLVIGPPGGGAATLAKLDPPEIYSTDPFWIPAQKKGDNARKLETVRLILQGQGFLTSTPGDNAVWIDGVRQNIVWDRACSDPNSPGTENSPKPHAIHGEVRSSEEIQLCFVPVPANGQLLLATGFGDTPSQELPFRVFKMGTAQVAVISFAIALALALLPLFLLRFVQKGYKIAGGDYRFRMLFLDPETDTYSLSKLQFYAWTVASIFGYAYLFISRVHVQSGSWPDVPATLPGIILVSAGTAIGSQMVTAANGPKGAGEEAPSFSDFITSGGVVAPDRLQMLLWTIVGVAAFLYAVLQLAPGTITDLPGVPERLLVLMGISSAGYLGGKMARKPGPVINEISIVPPESDEALRDQASPPAPLPDLVEPAVRAKAELGMLAPGTNADAAIGALKNAVNAASSAQTAAEFNQLIADLATFRDAAEAAATRAASDFLGGKATAADAQAAQAAAAAMQDLAAGVTQAISTAAAAPMALEETPPPIARTIELRGVNLSPDATLEIDNADLSFQMLLNSAGKNAPDVVARDETNPTFARVIRFNIDPARLPTVYREQVRQWFGKGGTHKFTLLNPDAQRSELTFNLPPGEAQKTGVSS
jgi:hypothetical protein